MDPINVWKRNLRNEITWRYAGEIIERGADFVRLEARFNRDDMPFMGITLKKNDRFVETFFTENWYNIFEIHDRDDDQIKGCVPEHACTTYTCSVRNQVRDTLSQIPAIP